MRREQKGEKWRIEERGERREEGSEERGKREEY